MDSYHLSKLDWDSMNELGQLAGIPNPIDSIAPTTKAAFTRAYNKGRHLLPYDTGDGMKKTRRGGGASGGDEADGEGIEGSNHSFLISFPAPYHFCLGCCSLVDMFEQSEEATEEDTQQEDETTAASGFLKKSSSTGTCISSVGCVSHHQETCIA